MSGLSPVLPAPAPKYHPRQPKGLTPFKRVLRLVINEHMIGVLVVDDHALVRRTLRAVLDGQSDLTVGGEAADGIEAIQLSQKVRPDVILMDMYMPRMDGVESTRQICVLVPESCIIGMSSDSSAWVERAFRSAGARAFLPKEMVPGHLVDVIQRECPK